MYTCVIVYTLCDCTQYQLVEQFTNQRINNKRARVQFLDVFYFFSKKKPPIVVIRDVCPSVRLSVRLSVCVNKFLFDVI